ncbi:MAG: hypothetical protein AAFU77_14255 [Myxococcota bacterium]
MRSRILLLALLCGCTQFRATAPEGFAPFEEWGAFKAVSPEGVTFQVRAEDNSPEADLAFWSEALKNRMDDAGYVFVEEGEVKANGRAGYSLLLAAPYGQQDYSYLVTLFVNGGTLIVVESAGEVTEFTARRPAVDAAIAALTF